jgi:ABC-type phosphate transport system auxiliary subunit
MNRDTNSPISFPYPSITFNNANREVLRITHDGRLIIGEGLSTEEATQQAAKLLIASFEKEIQKMVDARIAAELTRLRDENKLLRAAQKISEDSDGAIVIEVISLRARAEKAEDELAAEREKVKVLREALENLINEQNGAPLCTREEEWKQAMDVADAALAQTKEASK